MSAYFQASDVLQTYLRVHGTTEEEFRDSYIGALTNFSEMICQERSHWTRIPHTTSDVLEVFDELLAVLPAETPDDTSLNLPMVILRQRHIWPLVPADARLREIQQGQENAASAYAEDLADGLVGQPPLEVQLGMVRAEGASPRSGNGHYVPLPGMFQIRTPRDAELNAARWMNYFGFTDAAATPVGPDGGLDVLSSQAVAQVKAEASQTGVEAVQRLQGAATAGHRDKQLLFFVSSGFTRAAVSYADQVGIELYSYDFAGIPTPENPHARERARSLGWAATSGWIQAN